LHRRRPPSAAFRKLWAEHQPIKCRVFTGKANISLEHREEHRVGGFDFRDRSKQARP
jgi:hypothetical protein